MASARRSLIQRIEALHGEIAAQVKALRPEEVYWEPGGEEWTVIQILGHIAEFQTYFIRELLRVKEDPGSRWGRGFDHEGRLRAVAEARGQSLEAVVARIEAARREVIDTLEKLADEDLEIVAEHRNPKFGRKSMQWLVEHFIVEHLEEHLAQIRQNLRQQAASEGR